jgi:hypothetical protein
VTVGTNQEGRVFYVDTGTPYTTPQTFTWDIGSTHYIGTYSPQPGTADTRYVWDSWSNGGDMFQTITANTNTTSYIAHFTTQHRLTTCCTDLTYSNHVFPADEVVDALLDHGILGGVALGRYFDGMQSSLLVAATEKCTTADIARYRDALAMVLGAT